MKRRYWLLVIALMSFTILPYQMSQAAGTSLSYGGLQACYPVGGNLPNFTLRAQVATTAEYRMTHAVRLNGGSVGAATTVFSGQIRANQSQTATIAGGQATVAGTYTLIGSLYLVSTGALQAQATTTVLLANSCPTPTSIPPTIEPSSLPTTTPPPNPPASPTPTRVSTRDSDESDVQWSQLAVPSQAVKTGTILHVIVRGQNQGKAAGMSTARLNYDPQQLQLLDATPKHSGNWVQAHDPLRGRVIIALGLLNPMEISSIDLRFLVLAQTGVTKITLVRTDEQDRGNRLELEIGEQRDGPSLLELKQVGDQLGLSGQGYKPGESMIIWANLANGASVPIYSKVVPQADENGHVQLTLPAWSSTWSSLVIRGQVSDITQIGILNKQEHLSRLTRSKNSTKDAP